MTVNHAKYLMLNLINNHSMERRSTPLVILNLPFKSEVISFATLSLRVGRNLNMYQNIRAAIRNEIIDNSFQGVTYVDFSI